MRSGCGKITAVLRMDVVSCPDPPRTCEKEGLVTQVQILGLASEFESGQ